MYLGCQSNGIFHYFDVQSVSNLMPPGQHSRRINHQHIHVVSQNQTIYNLMRHHYQAVIQLHRRSVHSKRNENAVNSNWKTINHYRCLKGLKSSLSLPKFLKLNKPAKYNGVMLNWNIFAEDYSLKILQEFLQILIKNKISFTTGSSGSPLATKYIPPPSNKQK